MSNQIKFEQAMNMNRKDRRILGKINKVKIPSIINVPKEKQKDKDEK